MPRRSAARCFDKPLAVKTAADRSWFGVRARKTFHRQAAVPALFTNGAQNKFRIRNFEPAHQIFYLDALATRLQFPRSDPENVRHATAPSACIPLIPMMFAL
jgi:hypothetical protein